jgi:RNA polymerase sigma factor (sigma-70 family)
VYAPSFFRSDEALLLALRQGHRGARAVFFQRHVEDVEELLVRLLGSHGLQGDVSCDERGVLDKRVFSAQSLFVTKAEQGSPTLARLVRDVFLTATARLGTFKGSADSLRPWLLRLAVRRSEQVLRTRRWLAVLGLRATPAETFARVRDNFAQASDNLDRASDNGDSTPWVPEAAAYAVLDRLPVKLRVAFCLHYIAKLDIGEVAELCNVSLSVARRAVLRGRDRFLELALQSPELQVVL